MNNSQKDPIKDIKMISAFYESLGGKVERAKKTLNKPLTLCEKILYTHLYDKDDLKKYERGADYVNFSPDRVAMQDATAQMALLQFMNAGKTKSAVPTSVHCDHLIQADTGAKSDLETAVRHNFEVYDFLKKVSNKYNIGFWKPGAGIIHQIIFENYAFPGGMMVGTDSHTPNAGGMGMIAIGVGGADAVDVMAGMPWELKMPKITGIHLRGKLNAWASPKDIILKLAGMLTTKGGTDSIIEYFGEGTSTIAATGKATICNMGAEIGATCSIFPYDSKIAEFLIATGRKRISDQANALIEHLRADKEVYEQPEKYYDKIIEIDLSELEPYINGPFSPDAATPISEFAAKAKQNKWPEKLEVGLIGSCTNSSYQDLGKVTSIAEQAIDNGIAVKSELIIIPGSERIRDTSKNDGFLKVFEKIGARIMANACGPCIGQWKRHTEDNKRKNSILTSFNRNFAKRADGNPNTYAFVASPEITMALSIAGDICFNPLKDKLTTKEGKIFLLKAPKGKELPENGFQEKDAGYTPPEPGSSVEIDIRPDSQRLQILKPFPKWEERDFIDMPLLIKTKGKCTTDHISMAGPWLKFRGHLENISDNLLMGAVNAFNGKTNEVCNQLNSKYESVSSVAKQYKKERISSIVVAEENYGEGSSREHAAMEPRFLNVKVILAKSFARIHETNLKKQGMLALTFENKEDYDKIQEKDKISIEGLQSFSPGKELKAKVKHEDGQEDSIHLAHSYNTLQIKWFKAGSALNYIKEINHNSNVHE